LRLATAAVRDKEEEEEKQETVAKMNVFANKLIIIKINNLP
jgi:hypothetical protein